MLQMQHGQSADSATTCARPSGHADLYTHGSASPILQDKKGSNYHQHRRKHEMHAQDWDKAHPPATQPASSGSGSADSIVSRAAGPVALATPAKLRKGTGPGLQREGDLTFHYAGPVGRTALQNPHARLKPKGTVLQQTMLAVLEAKGAGTLHEIPGAAGFALFDNTPFSARQLFECFEADPGFFAEWMGGRSASDIRSRLDQVAREGISAAAPKVGISIVKIYERVSEFARRHRSRSPSAGQGSPNSRPSPSAHASPRRQVAASSRAGSKQPEPRAATSNADQLLALSASRHSSVGIDELDRGRPRSRATKQSSPTTNYSWAAPGTPNVPGRTPSTASNDPMFSKAPHGTKRALSSSSSNPAAVSRIPPQTRRGSANTETSQARGHQAPLAGGQRHASRPPSLTRTSRPASVESETRRSSSRGRPARCQWVFEDCGNLPYRNGHCKEHQLF